MFVIQNFIVTLCKCRSKSQVSRWIVYRSHNLSAIHLSCQSKIRSCKMISNCLQIVDSPWLCMCVASCQKTRNVYKVPFLKFRQFWPIFPTHLIAQEHFNFYLNHYISLSTEPLGAFRFCLGGEIMSWQMKGMISEWKLNIKRMNLHLQKSISSQASMEQIRARSVSQPYFKHLRGRSGPFINLFQIKYFELILR